MMQMHSFSTAKTIPNITESCATWRKHPHICTEDWDYKRIPFTTSTLCTNTIKTLFDKRCINTCLQRRTGTQWVLHTLMSAHFPIYASMKSALYCRVQFLSVWRVAWLLCRRPVAEECSHVKEWATEWPWITAFLSGLLLLVWVSKGRWEVDNCFSFLDNREHFGFLVFSVKKINKSVTSLSICYRQQFPEYDKYTVC